MQNALRILKSDFQTTYSSEHLSVEVPHRADRRHLDGLRPPSGLNLLGHDDPLDAMHKF